MYLLYSIMDTTNRGKGGRKPGPCEYTEVSHNGKLYIVANILYKDQEVKFVFDKEDYDIVRKYYWHLQSQNYIASDVLIEGTKKALYLHNLVMGKLTFNGKGQTETIDHINRIGLDNRKENLRLVTQSQQNMNQNRRERNVELPEGITHDDIPKHVWYVKPNGGHGDRFAIEFKSENIAWKSTSSKKKTIQEKLQETKQKLQGFYEQYPYLDPENPAIKEQIESLTNSYNAIIILAEL
jgi:hypothetical protein